MKASISYSEVSAILKKILNVQFSISYLSGDMIRVVFVPHELIGQIYVDLRFFLDTSGVLTLLVDSDSPGVNSIISGVMAMMSTKPNVFPYLRFDFPYVRVSLNKIPQLKSVLEMVSLSALVASPNGLSLNIDM